MYKVIVVSISDDDISKLNTKKKESVAFNKRYFSQFTECIQNSNNVIDMNKKMDELFPTENTDIFISHSHKDIDTANKVKDFLENTFNVSVFIDSNVWKNSNDYLRDLDNQYCRNVNEDTYNYDKRNNTTTHVHMMLATSILHAMDKSECIILLQSPNYSQQHTDNMMKTNSAWIYLEALTSQLLRIKIPKRVTTFLEHSMKKVQDSKLEFIPEYSIDISKLKTIDFKSVLTLQNRNLRKTEFLDALYKL